MFNPQPRWAFCCGPIPCLAGSLEGEAGPFLPFVLSLTTTEMTSPQPQSGFQQLPLPLAGTALPCNAKPRLQGRPSVSCLSPSPLSFLPVSPRWCVAAQSQQKLSEPCPPTRSLSFSAPLHLFFHPSETRDSLSKGSARACVLFLLLSLCYSPSLQRLGPFPRQQPRFSLILPPSPLPPRGPKRQATIRLPISFPLSSLPTL